MIITKKYTPLLVLKILQEYSDENHYLTQNQILDLIKEKYQVNLERKSIGAAINFLLNFNYNIIKAPRGGYALISRLFENDDIKYINDAIFSSKYIDLERSYQIIDKINSTLSIYKKKKIEHLLKGFVLKNNNINHVFDNIEIINQAIENNKKITFQSKIYNFDGQLILKNNGKRYTVSPYYIVNNLDRYYLLYDYNEESNTFKSLRIDNLENIEISKENIELPSIFKTNEQSEPSNFKNNISNLFFNNLICAKVEIFSPNYIQHIADYFSKYTISKEGDRLYANITSDESAIIKWILYYGEKFRLVSPLKTLEKIKSYLEKQSEIYKIK